MERVHGGPGDTGSHGGGGCAERPLAWPPRGAELIGFLWNAGPETRHDVFYSRKTEEIFSAPSPGPSNNWCPSEDVLRRGAGPRDVGAWIESLNEADCAVTRAGWQYLSRYVVDDMVLTLLREMYDPPRTFKLVPPVFMGTSGQRWVEFVHDLASVLPQHCQLLWQEGALWLCRDQVERLDPQ